MENLIVNQGLNFKKLERLHSNFRKDSKARKTGLYCEKLMEKLKNLGEDFSNSEVKIRNLLSGDAKDLESPYFAEDISGQFEDLHFVFSVELQELLEEFTRCSKNSQSTSCSSNPNEPQTAGNTNREDINLPRITVPKFTSSYEDWISFRDLFTAIIHNRSGLSDVQKLHYLKSSLSGESETLVKHIAITDTNYKIAWKILCDRYDNERALLNVYFKKLFSIHSANESASSVRTLLDKTIEATQAIQSMGLPDLWQATLVFLTAQRLPSETRRLWESEISKSTEISFDELKLFLEQRFRALEASNTITPRHKPHAATRHVNNTYRQAPMSCCMCKGEHYLRSCEQFNALDHYGKLNFVKKKNLCINCLGFGHRAMNCPSSKRCTKCNQAHHSVLHREDPRRGAVGTEQVGIHSVGSSRSKDVLLATALVTIASPNGRVILRALLDQGSQASLISEGAMGLLGLSRKTSKIHITGINGGSTSTNVKGITTVQLIDSNDEIICFDALILDRLTNLIPTNAISTRCIKQLKDIHLADPEFFIPNKVDILLGADMYARLVLDGVIKLTEGAIAQRTKIGWILSGEMDISGRRAIQSYKVETSENLDLELNEQLKKFWEIEEGLQISRVSDDDQRCEAHYVANTRRRDDGRFIVSLPFKSEQAKESIGHSRLIAKASFDSLERRFTRDNKFKIEYVKTINSYIDEGFMSPIDREDIVRKGNYLPHHAVIKESSSTKLRVVFDASRKSSSGVSLNDALLSGPALQNELIAVLMRFRQFQFAIVADITKMFCQIGISKDDSHFQRVLWRPDPSQPVKDYRITTVTFGTTCAPFLAIRTLRQLAEEERSKYPLGAQMVLDDFYVDDMLSGANDLDMALQKRREVFELLKSGGFKLRKWLTNDPRLLEGIPSEDIEMGDALDLDLDRSFKSLGIQWHPINDYFSFRVNLPMRTQHTKRTILSDVASLYDPLGWISPVIISLKILLRSIWQRGCSWDSLLPNDLESHWVYLRDSLKNIQYIKIPRWILREQTDRLELHGFCDASQNAYAAVVYLVSRGNNETKIRLLISKTKVAPIKTVTIPKLELCGAVVLSRLVKMMKEVHNFHDITTWLWCDNTTVISWIQGHPSRWSIFVANRTVEIYNNVSNTSWRYVPSHDNPADLGSRGVMATEIIDKSVWWNVPQWLLEEDTGIWPELQNVEETNLELRKNKTLKCLTIQNSDLEQLLHKFSTITKLCRVTAYCMRFRSVTTKKDVAKGNLTSKELNRALTFWVRYVQLQAFGYELQRIRKKKPLKGKYQISNLNPFFDSNEILRVGGRLKNSSLSYAESHPIILPKCGKLTELVLNDAHHATLHGHTQLMLAHLRKKFWIIDGRNAIRHFVHKCIRCFKCKASPCKQMMGDLPSPRVNITRPFTHTGIDYCGPFFIRDRKGRGHKTVKCYVCIFICLTVKAMHIELVSDLTTDAFLAALQRFIARRGLAAHIYSDCGSNFVGAEAELRKIIRSNNAVADRIVSKGVDWHFNPPAAPHFGGLWEAGVKSTKYHIRRIVGSALLTFEEFNTVLTQIEACLNSRPLCPITDDPNDDTALTPGHFLIGDSLLAHPQVDITDTPMNRLDRWQLTQRLVQGFWKRWSNEYLQRLQQRPKWLDSVPNVRVGDLCLVKEDKIPPYKWPLARISEVHPGTDGHVRVVTIRRKDGFFKRPVVKISLLPKMDSE